jgi:serine/threonine protein kinase
MADSDAVFCQAAIKSQLISEKDLKEAVRELRAEASDEANTVVEVSDEKMADQLVKMGLVNRWQAEQLKRGRTRFHLKDYQIIDSIGQGGMGQVFKAEHSVMGRVVAIKVLPKSRSTDDAVASFQREIRTLANLDHPNLVRAYDAGHDGNVHFLVTEFVPGTDLRHLVRHAGGMHEQDAATLVRDVARGLEHAHQCGLVHRDVKPGNIMVTPDGMVKVLDLGLAGFLQEELELHGSKEKNSKRGRIVGTADYLAPEVIEGHPATAASDIYGLGCTLYYAATRKVPFPGGNSVQKCHRHLSERPMDPRRFRQDMSDDFLGILNDMMAKDPLKRIQTAAEVVERLAPWSGANNLSGRVEGEEDVRGHSHFARADPPGGEEMLSDSRVFPEMETPLSGSGSLRDTVQQSGGSQLTAPLPPPRKGRRTQKMGGLFKEIAGRIGAMSEIQFYSLVGGLSFLVLILLIMLLSF